MKSVLKYDRAGTPDQAVVDDHFTLYTELLGQAITNLCKEKHYHIPNQRALEGMLHRFCDRASSHGAHCYDTKSHSYKWWEEGYYAMNAVIEARTT